MPSLVPTQGFALHTTPYSETSIIVKIFTRELGLRSYIVKGVRKTSGRQKLNLFQPLAKLDLVVYNNRKASVNYIREMSLTQQPIPTCSEYENAIRFFMTELLLRTLPNDEPIPSLFDYVSLSLGQLPSIPASFPFTFLIIVSRHLGIAPLDNYSTHEPLFNLKDGRYVAPPSRDARFTDPNIDYILPSPVSSRLHHHLFAAYSSSSEPMFSLSERIELINTLLEYYRLHVADFRNFHSHEILHSVLS